MSSKTGSASAPSSTDMGATAAAAASSFMKPKPVFGRREGKRRQQKDRKPLWCDFDQKKDFKVWSDIPNLLTWSFSADGLTSNVARERTTAAPSRVVYLEV